MRNKVVIFDWGGVIENSSVKNGDQYRFWHRVIGQLKPDVTFGEVERKIKEAYSFNGLLYNAERFNTDSSVNNFVRGMLRAFNIEVNADTVARFKKAYTKIGYELEFSQEIVDYIHSLRGRCSIGLLSNCMQLDKPRQDMQINRAAFDYIWLSADMHLRKPDVDLFFKVQKCLHMPVKDILFIDDNKENIESAKRIGWNVLHCDNQDLDEIKRVVEEFLSE